jgi:protein-glucosylgalactosylhydroxylysine glucosidase
VTNQKNNVFYGLSPTGLGRGGTNLNDYEGHTFWDSEIWMQPVIGLINPQWLEVLLHYRFLKLEVAKEHAKSTGYAGARLINHKFHFTWFTK